MIASFPSFSPSGKRTWPRRAIYVVALFAFCFATPLDSRAERLKDIASIRGINDNALVGYGLVVGLAGTGDTQQSVQTQQMVANVLSRRFGTVISPADIKAKNVAVVMVSARLPPFSRRGRKIDVTVSSASNAKSLYGGTLLPTALKGGNGAVYAWAEGPLTVGGFSVGGSSGSSVTKNHPTVGQIPGGALVAKEINYRLNPDEPITIALKNPDFTTASRTAFAINNRLGQKLARALDPSTVQVVVPARNKGDLVNLIATIEGVEVNPDQRAKIVINERTGTVVMGAGVQIAASAISHGTLTLQISENPGVSQPNPMAKGNTTAVPSTQVEVIESGGEVHMIPKAPTLGKVVHALNSLGVRPQDLVAILMALQSAGALKAQVEIR